jgi:hypothetical protein
MKIFETAKRSLGEPIDFQIDDDKFTFTPVSTTSIYISSLMGHDLHSQTRTQLNWLSAGLPEDQAQRILDRLLDPEDYLDVQYLDSIVAWLIKEMAGRPTGPSPD